MTGVEQVLVDQTAAWNRGDIDGFCAYCADDVVYVGADGVTVGRAAVVARYHAAYADRAAMGTLALLIDRVDARGATAIVVARWSVGHRGGQALLVFRREDAGWRLAYDATIAG